jgi:hypothetical protein
MPIYRVVTWIQDDLKTMMHFRINCNLSFILHVTTKLQKLQQHLHVINSSHQTQVNAIR